MAIFGLIIVGFSIYIPLQRLEEFGRSGMRVDVAYQPIIEKLILVDDAARVELACAISQAEKREGTKVTTPTACDNVSSKKAVATEASEELVTLRSKATDLELERNFFFQQYRRYFLIGIFSGLLGICLCIGGFWLWYVRLQRYLDAAARKDA